jgi:transcriptional regulator with XRE-family HTH domain
MSMTFGERLRAAREERGLSQTQMGGDRYSASYISHLERDRRRPSPAAVEYLAERLRMHAEELASPPTTALAQAQLDVTISYLRVQDAFLRHDFEAVIADTTAIAVEAALTDASAWWMMLKMRAEALHIHGEYEESLAVSSQLVDAASTSDQLRAWALALQSRTLRASGRLVEALSAAVEACKAGSADTELLCFALRAEIAARGELGQREELAATTERLAKARMSLTDGQSKGEAAWTVGNVSFMLGDPDQGVREHDLAATFLSPTVDLRTWARFHKASAGERIAAGMTEGVDEFLDRAQRGLDLAGNAHDLAELDLVRAEWLLSTAPGEAEHLVKKALQTPDLPGQTIAEASTVRARALELQDKPDEAHDTWLQAAEQYEASGAHERAVGVWRQLAQRGSAS